MTTKEKDVNNMKCWVFRMAQTTWHKTPSECMAIFTQNKLFEYINNTYDYLHLNGYRLVLHELEEILSENGVSINA